MPLVLARRPPPRDEHELRIRAFGLAGRTVAEVARALGSASLGGGAHTKGKLGELMERALGAGGGHGHSLDFPDLGIELKTVPVDRSGKPVESTFVCAYSLADADRAVWATSWVRAKLAHVLFLPVAGPPGAAWDERTIGVPVFFRPSREVEATLAADFDEIVGAIGAGRIESVSARVGRVLQLRPKAATGRARTMAFGAEGERLATVPRGFYLRARFTRTILVAP